MNIKILNVNFMFTIFQTHIGFITEEKSQLRVLCLSYYAPRWSLKEHQQGAAGHYNDIPTANIKYIYVTSIQSTIFHIPICIFNSQ